MAHFVYALHEARQPLHLMFDIKVVLRDRLAMRNRCIRLIGIFISVSRTLNRHKQPAHCPLGVIWAQFARYLVFHDSNVTVSNLLVVSQINSCRVWSQTQTFWQLLLSC